jgi:hypothetical protein
MNLMTGLIKSSIIIWNSFKSVIASDSAAIFDRHATMQNLKPSIGVASFLAMTR